MCFAAGLWRNTMVADSSQLVSASPRTLAFWARMRVCENNQREREKYEYASIRECEFTRINRENPIKTRTRVCKIARTEKDENTSRGHEKDEYAKTRGREDVNKLRKRETKQQSARYTAQLETLKRVFFVPSQPRKLKQRSTHEADIVTFMVFF